MDRDRRERERELLLLLLLYFATAYRHARSAARVGADPYAAVRDVLAGNPALGLPGLAVRLAPLLLLADYAGWRRTLLVVPGVSVPPSPDDVPRRRDYAALLLLLLATGYRAAADYRARAFQAAGQLAATLQRRMSDGLSKPAPDGRRGVAFVLWALAYLWERWGYTKDKPWSLRGAAETLVGEAYQGGYAAGLGRPELVDAGMTGLRYAATLDERTSDICRTYDAVRLPAGHPWWRSHWPQNHWHCRAVVLPVFGRFTPTPESDVPWEPPPERGFGAAPVAYAGYAFGRVA